MNNKNIKLNNLSDDKNDAGESELNFDNSR